MTGNHLALVQQVKAQLEAKGQPWHTNEEAFEITGRVAWTLRAEGAQLILKTTAQNGAMLFDGPLKGRKVSHDSLAFPDGWVDLLISAGPPANTNGPQWDWHPGAPTGGLVPPFDLDAGVTVPVDPGPGEPPSAPPVEAQALAEALRSVAENLQALTQVVAEVKAVQARGLKVPYLGVALPPPPS